MAKTAPGSIPSSEAQYFNPETDDRKAPYYPRAPRVIVPKDVHTAYEVSVAPEMFINRIQDMYPEWAPTSNAPATHPIPILDIRWERAGNTYARTHTKGNLKESARTQRNTALSRAHLVPVDISTAPFQRTEITPPMAYADPIDRMYIMRLYRIIAGDIRWRLATPHDSPPPAAEHYPNRGRWAWAMCGFRMPKWLDRLAFLMPSIPYAQLFDIAADLDAYAAGDTPAYLTLSLLHRAPAAERTSMPVVIEDLIASYARAMTFPELLKAETLAADRARAMEVEDAATRTIREQHAADLRRRFRTPRDIELRRSRALQIRNPGAHHRNWRPGGGARGTFSREDLAAVQAIQRNEQDDFDAYGEVPDPEERARLAALAIPPRGPRDLSPRRDAGRHARSRSRSPRGLDSD